jgi:membrane-associated HD superfamily phosphohydrolase
MADKQSFIQIAESIQHISFLKDFPSVSEDERGELEEHLRELASRQESKFDSIIGLIKKCDAYIEALQNEMNEIKLNLDAWKKNKDKITNIIKFAYQQNLIDGAPTGIKYQATIKRVKPRVVDNCNMWSEDEVSEFGLKKTTTVTRIKDGTVVDVKEETLPDKDKLRQALVQDQGDAPLSSQLVPSVAFVYERRKRLTS